MAGEERQQCAVPWDFGPPTGRGMRATRQLSKGDVVLRIPGEQLVTPSKCRKLLLSLASLDTTIGCSLTQEFESLHAAQPGCGAQVCENAEAVFSACRTAGIDVENDEARRKLLGEVVLIISIDPSDDTVEVRRPSEPDGECVWFAVGALRKPSLTAAVAAISDENILVTALAASRSLRERQNIEGSDAASHEIAVEQSCCSGLGVLFSEMPAEVGLTAEWSDEELEGLSGSLHASRLRRCRKDLLDAHSIVRGLLSGSASGWGLANLRVTEELFSWAWVRVASRHRSSSAFPSICGSTAGKTVMIPGGADLFNHSIALPPGQSTRESSDGLFVEVVAAADCAEGDEVFISYGAKANSELLLGYGFAVEKNPFDRVELIITLDRLNLSSQNHSNDANSIRASLCLDCIAFHARASLESGREEADCELMRTTSGGGQPEVRIALATQDPLPGVLLGLSRLERLSDRNLAILRAGIGPQEFIKRLQNGQSFIPATAEPGLETSSGSQDTCSIRCTALRGELQTLCSLRALFQALLSGYPASVQRGDGEKSAARADCCAILCGAEKAILHEALQRTECLIKEALRQSLETACMVRGPNGNTNNMRQQWIKSKENVEACANDVVQFFNELGSLAPLASNIVDAMWTQTCAFFFLLLHGAHLHPLVDEQVPDVQQCWRPACVRLSGDAAPNEPLRSGEARRILPRRFDTWNDAEKPEYLSLFIAKTSMWGRYLLAQFLTAGALSIEAMSSMAMESVDIRKHHAWSVPTPEALELLTSAAPLVEIGAGWGLWAGLLQKRGVDIRAFELGAWHASFSQQTGDVPAGDGFDSTAVALGKVERGGPDALSGLGASYKTLVLMWPDYAGAGTFGLECVQRWTLEEKGQRIICIGEWRSNGTFGSFSPDLPPHGQSFSAACQDFVEEHFELVQVLALPNWPLFLDGLRVFERR